MTKIPLITTGLNGLVGSKFAQLYQDQYQLTNLDLRDDRQPTDITNFQQVLDRLASNPASAVLHLAAYTDVSGAWAQKDDQSGIAYQVNVVGTKNLIKACQETNKYLIHISTAYVFDGQKDTPYVETDQPAPIEWYGQTKWLAEQAVMASDLKWSILRIDQPFRSDPFAKIDLAHRIVAGLQQNNLPPMFTNHHFGPTFIDDLAKVFDYFINHQPTGVYHATSGESWTDYDLAQLIKKTWQLPGEIQAGDLTAYLKKLTRPYQINTALDSSKLINLLDFSLVSIDQAVKQLIF